jgi:ribosomal protein S12
MAKQTEPPHSGISSQLGQVVGYIVPAAHTAKEKDLVVVREADRRRVSLDIGGVHIKAVHYE